jgi:thiamine transport system permease protein
LVIGLIALFFISPLAAVVVDGVAAKFDDLLIDSTFQLALATSFGIAIVSTVSTVLMALALVLARRELVSPLRKMHNKLNHALRWLLNFSGMLYMAVPALVMGLGFFLIAQVLFENTAVVAPIAVIAANVLVALPFVVVILSPAAEKAALRFDRQAMALSLSRLDRWRIVDWPLMRSELGFASALAFCFSFGDLSVIALFGSQDFCTLPWLLYQKMGSYQTTEAAGIALFLFAIIIVAFIAIPKLADGRSRAFT